MADGEITTIGRCYLCKRTFSFTPSSVMTVMMDSKTNLPLGMMLSGNLREPTPEETARSVEEHVCSDCVDRVKKLGEFMNQTPRFGTWHSGNP